MYRSIKTMNKVERKKKRIAQCTSFKTNNIKTCAAASSKHTKVYLFLCICVSVKFYYRWQLMQFQSFDLLFACATEIDYFVKYPGKIKAYTHFQYYVEIKKKHMNGKHEVHMYISRYFIHIEITSIPVQCLSYRYFMKCMVQPKVKKNNNKKWEAIPNSELKFLGNCQ